jgi:hypothetical protein
MSAPINSGGGPAFPTLFIEPEYGSGYKGMTLRDYFAAQALTGILGSGDAKLENIISDKSATAEFAQSCYIIADAMLKAREASK